MYLGRILLAGAIVLTAASANAIPTSTNVPGLPSLPANQYAKLDRTACEAELTKRSISFKSETATKGVLAPVRLTGPLHGVTFHSPLSPEKRAVQPWDILDCRLVLALDDFSQILEKHDVVDVVHFSVYRPPILKPNMTTARQHGGALAIDAAVFVKKDGTKLQVEKDFHGRIGAPTCGSSAAPAPATPEATALRDIVCTAADQHLFNVVLTPDYNWAHRNHFHLEVSGASYFLVR
jgi:hypothetical protein